MTDTVNPIRWNILADNEVTQKKDDAFGVHTAYAKLLKQLAQEAPTPFSIGLYSSWGTGKTSIVRILEELVAGEEDNGLAVIYLDVWRYSADPLKRWILLETERQLANHKLLTTYRFEDRTLQSHLEFEEELEDENHLEIDFKNFGLVLGVAIGLAAAAFVAWLYLPTLGKLGKAISALLAIIASGGIVAAILTTALKKLGEALSGLVFRRTLRHISAKPAFSSEKFAQIFRDLVSRITSGPGKRRLIFVFDNLDRCPADVGVDLIGVIKTFLDVPGCVYIVPCDEEAILTHIRAKFLLPGGADDSDEQANQFLAKFFQMTLRLPPAADFAVEDYVDKELREAKMEDLGADARDVLVLAYRNETPRQVKRILNDLIAYRGVAEQIESEGLVEKGALTTDLGHLTKMAVLSAKWPSFMRRLADDPVLWTDVMQRIRTQGDPGPEDIPSDLHQFLWNTRLVSPDADIRPWLYFRRGALERDAPLHRRIEEILQNGNPKPILDMLADESLKDKKDDILGITSTIVRRWRTNNRRVLLRNAAPVILKISLAEPRDSEVAREAREVLDYMATNASPEEMEQLFDVSDVLQLTSDSPHWQRHKLLKRYAALFQTGFPRTDARFGIWKQLIQNRTALDSADQKSISTDISSRYTVLPNGEVDTLSLLQYVSEDLEARQWCVSEALLAAISNLTTFDGSEVDKKRVQCLTAFRKIETRGVIAGVVSKIAQLIDPARTSTADPQAQNAISALLKYEPDLLGQSNSNLIADRLFVQANRTAVADRKWWALGLYHLDPVFDQNAQAQMTTLHKSTFVEADPAETNKFTASIHKSWLSRLLRSTQFNAVLKMQTAIYAARYASGAPAHRQQVLAAFAAADLLRHPEVFDAAISWDLATYIQAASRALDDKQVTAEEAGRFVEDLCSRHLPASLSTNGELYAALLELLTKHPEVITARLSEIMASCQIAKILAGEYPAYSLFVKFRQGLPDDDQLSITRNLFQPLKTRKESWVTLLNVLVADVSSEGGRALRDPQFLDDLADYSFSAARDEWSEVGDSLTKIVALLAPNRQQASVDRALDSLISLEAEGDELPKLEPYLRLIAAQTPHLSGQLAAQTTKFVQRMLGVSKSEAEKATTLDFLKHLGPSLIEASKVQVDAIASSSDDKLAQQARELLGRQTGESKDL
ncbi:MAG TPA: P-loop NTPase fold protein [Terriglobales bacterium]|nr:P-loop NTPase fold protein [Terriglobales bacterium]